MGSCCHAFSFDRFVLLGGLTVVSISQNDVGHLMRFIQCRILYGYITDVHENRTLFIKRKTERIEVKQRIGFWGFSNDLQCLGLSTDLKTVSCH